MSVSDLGLVYRATKGVALTHDEMDRNFRRLEDAYLRLDQLLSSGSGVAAGVSPPGNKALKWLYTDTDGVTRIYVWSPGENAWVSLHPILSGDDRRMLWPGSEAAIATIDNGADVTVTPTEGPFWEIDEDYQGRVPVGAGIAQSGGSDIVNAHDWISGSQGISSVAVPVPVHRHGIGNVAAQGFISIGTTTTPEYWTTATAPATPTVAGHAFQPFSSTALSWDSATALQTGSLWSTEPLLASLDDPDDDSGTVEQPGVGNYVLKRTARSYYKYVAP